MKERFIKANIKTIADMQKTVKGVAKSAAMNGKVVYLRLLAVSSFKKVPVERF